MDSRTALRPLLLLAALTGLVSASSAVAAEPGVFGVWRNPKGSVHLEVRPCGASACGYVIWASDAAQEDARRGSGKPLVGQQLLQDFHPDGGGWRGKVYVPDMDRTFSGSARLLDPGRLEARGCLLGRVLCKRQVWTRLEGGAAD
ncbi:DUF2147 domain-containing protein [Phenylobacterium sp.]|uniref:DUF2147 domain-containing protein n=1 Tax=Phenylobacterium sp. TaxID=1871053 RepID=UPI002F93B1C9